MQHGQLDRLHSLRLWWSGGGKGVTAMEYALIGAAIFLAVAVVIPLVAGNLAGLFQTAADRI